MKISVFDRTPPKTPVASWLTFVQSTQRLDKSWAFVTFQAILYITYLLTYLLSEFQFTYLFYGLVAIYSFLISPFWSPCWLAKKTHISNSMPYRYISWDSQSQYVYYGFIFLHNNCKNLLWLKTSCHEDLHTMEDLMQISWVSVGEKIASHYF